MSANHPNRLGLLGGTLVTALAMGLAAPAFAQRGSASREGTAEFGLQVLDLSGGHVNGPHSSSLDVSGDVGWGMVGGYNFTDKFQLGGEISWASPSYRLKLVPDGGPAIPLVNTNMDISTFILTGMYNFLDGPVTPYAEIGAGWVHIDSNVASGPPSTGCWWDPWWGYICSTYYSTYNDTRTAWTYALGVRWDVSEAIALRASYGIFDLSTSHATQDAKPDTWRAEIVWKF